MITNLFFTCVPLGALFFHLRASWRPISINCTLHISKMFVITTFAVISNLYVVTVNKLFNIFRLPLNILVRTPEGMRSIQIALRS